MVKREDAQGIWQGRFRPGRPGRAFQALLSSPRRPASARVSWDPNRRPAVPPAIPGEKREEKPFQDSREKGKVGRQCRRPSFSGDDMVDHGMVWRERAQGVW